MSYTEFHTGKLKKIELPDAHNLEDFCREQCIGAGFETLPTWTEDWVELFRDKFDGYNKNLPEYFIHGETVYQVLEHTESNEEEYFMRLNENSDGTINFIGQFYNGGTGFSEMLEESLDNLNK